MTVFIAGFEGGNNNESFYYLTKGAAAVLDIENNILKNPMLGLQLSNGSSYLQKYVENGSLSRVHELIELKDEYEKLPLYIIEIKGDLIFCDILSLCVPADNILFRKSFDLGKLRYIVYNGLPIKDSSSDEAIKFINASKEHKEYRHYILKAGACLYYRNKELAKEIKDNESRKS